MPYERSKNIGKYRLNSMANKANLEPDPQTLSHTEHFFFHTCHSIGGSSLTCSTPWQPPHRDRGTCPTDHSPNQQQVGAGDSIHFLVCSGLTLRVVVCRFPDTQARETPTTHR